MPPRSHSSEDDLDRPLVGGNDNDSGRDYKSSMLADCDDDDRRGFVKKVYGILATQLTLTFGWTAVVCSSTDLQTSM